jgi:phosphoglycerol transferase MdoB-like AlkP superfamily enzyme
MVESLNGNFIERRNASGREFTPFLNSLIKQGLYIENYYSNSIQTSRSQFSTLTSVLPSFRGKEFADYLNVNYYTIAQALKENSYYTIFFQALEDLRFDNTDKFMNKNGFDEVLTFKKYKKPGDEKNYYSWGVSDNVFFARFFDFLNDVKNNNKSNKPLFMLLATIGNHMNCDRIKPNERTFYKEPKNTFECYCNSVYVTDSALKYFFETIKKDSIFNNSIFIVTGDHPYPLGEHGFANNEASFYEEFYKIPLVMIGNGINPKRITDMAYSHLDLAPTIADLAGISLDRVPWQGISMVQQEKCHHPVYFIQPYSGRYTTVLDYPLKYTKRLRTGDEYLFNLKTDPQEQCNLIRNNDYLKNIVQLREELKTIFLNQRMLEENRIWNGK